VDDFERDSIIIDIIPGDSLSSSYLFDGKFSNNIKKGILFKTTFSYAGFEQQKKFFKNPKILLLNHEVFF
jgi:T-complex protein 1 subunit eta